MKCGEPIPFDGTAGLDRREMLKMAVVASGVIPLLSFVAAARDNLVVSRGEPEARSGSRRNVWTNASGDGKASTPSNWSLGRIPQSRDEDIVFNATCQDDCIVDAHLDCGSFDGGGRKYKGTIYLIAHDLTIWGSTTM